MNEIVFGKMPHTVKTVQTDTALEKMVYLTKLDVKVGHLYSLFWFLRFIWFLTYACIIFHWVLLLSIKQRCVELEMCWRSYTTKNVGFFSFESISSLIICKIYYENTQKKQEVNIQNEDMTKYVTSTYLMP